MIPPKDILATIMDYVARFPDDRPGLSKLIDALSAGQNATDRKLQWGHITCGAVLLGNGQALMIQHKSLRKWLLPGGHIESDDESLIEAATRELMEEVGVDASALTPAPSPFDDLPIHIDCHPIPENPAKGEGAHQHYDFRYVFHTNQTRLTVAAEEVIDAQWVNLTELPPIIAKRLAELDSR